MPFNTLANKKASTFLRLAQIGKHGNNTLSTYNDPLFFAFQPIFHFTAASGLLATEDKINSARAHLKRIGEMERYELLNAFIDLLGRFCDEAPWMFKSVSGLEEINMLVAEPRFINKKITIELYEAVDFRANSLIDLYRAVAFDYDRFVEVLPDNLRHFSMSVAVTDARILQADGLGNNRRLFGRDVDSLSASIENITHKMFHFGKCSFDENMGQSKFSDIRDDDFTPKDSELSITYKVHAYSGRFNAITGDIKLDAGTKDRPLGKVYDNGNKGRFAPITDQLGRIKTIATETVDYNAQADRLKSIVRDTIDTGIQYGANLIEGQINRTLLGNVYKDDISDVLNLLNADRFQQIRNVFEGR